MLDWLLQVSFYCEELIGDRCSDDDRVFEITSKLQDAFEEACDLARHLEAEA